MIKVSEYGDSGYYAVLIDGAIAMSPIGFPVWTAAEVASLSD